jgi:ribosomal silencing factor RsfS
MSKYEQEQAVHLWPPLLYLGDGFGGAEAVGGLAQLKAIANEIETRLQEDHSVRPVAIDGFPVSQWVVLDYLQVVVHVFHRDKRSFYSLEDLWGDAPRFEWEPAAAP